MFQPNRILKNFFAQAHYKINSLQKTNDSLKQLIHNSKNTSLGSTKNLEPKTAKQMIIGTWVLQYDKYDFNNLSEDSRDSSYGCENCGGEGSIECRDCDGSGSLNCGYCDGNGTEIETDEEEGEIETDCSECRGSGTETCNNCDGQGWETCNNCDGQGYFEDEEIFSIWNS